MLPELTPSLQDQIGDSNVITHGLPDESFVQDDDAFPPGHDDLSDEDLILLAQAHERRVEVPESFLRDVLTLRQLERKIANWKLENDEREDAIVRAEGIEDIAATLLGAAESRRSA